MTDFGRRTGAHKTTHQDGGTDEISIAGLSGQAADDQPAAAHALGGTKHQSATLAQLNAKVSDANLDDSGGARTPSGHKVSHQVGGADEISIAGLVGRINLVDRGDPASADWSLGNLTTDGTWRDLDLSAIVPAGAIAVKIRVSINDNQADSNFMLRKKGNVNSQNATGVRTQYSGVWIEGNFDVFCDINRVVQYLASDLVWTGINVVIRGWFI